MGSAHPASRASSTTRRWALVGLLALLAVGLAAVLAVRSLRESRGAASTLAPEARTVVVAEEFLAEDPSVPFASTIQMVRSGPAGPRVIRTFGALGAPDLAMSPDGTRLYVVSGDRRGDELMAFDVATGRVEMTVQLRPEGRLFRVSGWPLPCCPATELSPDGRWLFLVWVTPGDEGERTFFVATFDTIEERMLPEMMPLQDCEPGIRTLVPLSGDRRLAVVCGVSADVRFLEASPAGGLAASDRVELPPVRDVRQLPFGELDFADPAWAVASSDRRLLYVVRLNGRISIVDLERRGLVGEQHLDLGPDRHVGYGQVHLSGESMFLGLGPMSDGHDVSTATDVMEVETTTWAQRRTVPAGTWFGSFAVTPGGDVYVASHPKGLLLVDMASGRVADVPGVGTRHEMLEVAG